MPIKGAVWEFGYRLRPARRAFGTGAMAVVKAIFVPISLAVAGVSRLADVLGAAVDRVAAIGAWIGDRLDLLTRIVRPHHAVALAVVAAALALAASQFVDYHGVGVGASDYTGEVGSVAPAPNTDRATTGSAHAYVLLPVAIAALVLTVLTFTGRWRLGRGIALLGLAGIAVSLAIDLPQGLDAGIPGVAYYGAKAELLEGFWAQLAASATLVALGLLLGAYVRGGSSPRARYYKPTSSVPPSPGSPATPGEAGA